MALAESLIEPVSSQVVQILCTMSAKDFFRDFSPPISGLTPFPLHSQMLIVARNI